MSLSNTVCSTDAHSTDTHVLTMASFADELTAISTAACAESIKAATEVVVDNFRQACYNAAKEGAFSAKADYYICFDHVLPPATAYKKGAFVSGSGFAERVKSELEALKLVDIKVEWLAEAFNPRIGYYYSLGEPRDAQSKAVRVKVWTSASWPSSPPAVDDDQTFPASVAYKNDVKTDDDDHLGTGLWCPPSVWEDAIKRIEVETDKTAAALAELVARNEASSAEDDSEDDDRSTTSDWVDGADELEPVIVEEDLLSVD